jgi:hypothetical protein
MEANGTDNSPSLTLPCLYVKTVVLFLSLHLKVGLCQLFVFLRQGKVRLNETRAQNKSVFSFLNYVYFSWWK